MAKGDNQVKESEYTKELAKIATEKWQTSKDTLQPLEDMMIVDTKRGITQEQRGKVAGAIGASHQSQFAKVGENTLKGLAASGVDPTSGKFKESLSDISRAGGESRAAAEAEGEAGLQSNQLEKEMNLIRVGSGEASQAQQGISNVARMAADKARTEASLAGQEREGLRQLAGTAAGGLYGYYGQKKSPAEFDAAHAKKFGIKG